MEPNRVTVNGIDFAYLEKGQGPLVLCLHGFPDHAPTWTHLLDDLAGAGFRAVAPWMRGYPPTGAAPDGKYHTQYLSLDALALADALAGDGPAYVVGSDWGAGAVHGAITHRPDRFLRAVTMAVPPQAAMAGSFLSSPEQWKRSWYIWFFGTPLADIAFGAADFAIIDKLWTDWSPGFDPGPEFMAALKRCFAGDNGQAAMGYYRDSFHGRSAPEGEAASISAGAVTVPMLYFHGVRDGCLGIDLIDEAALREALGPSGDYVAVQDAGHFLHLEKPREVGDAVVAFLQA